MIDKRVQGSPETVIIHVCTNELRTTRNFDFVMKEVYTLVDTAKRKLRKCRVFLSGVLRRRDVSCRLTGALNDKYVWGVNAF